MEGTGSSVPGGPRGTRGPRRLRGTLNPPGTAARSNNGRGVCGPGRPKVEEPGQSGQRASVPRSALLCGESGSLTPLWTRPLSVSMHGNGFVLSLSHDCSDVRAVGSSLARTGHEWGRSAEPVSAGGAEPGGGRPAGRETWEEGARSVRLV
ncbi:hypothetical protein GCM10010259_33130 [Streptomyces daghestanicus]|uniref:Uncharacterized protein n=2 Tax=Streptomyces TaxID=1883 RepID=A0A918LAS1_STRGD|nr:hypothetical protein GCM10010238_14540 [Streptomyces niveoruber]GGS85053.1 hypothetical protein GCM10010240_18120 [Streptomyces griseoviridis]GGU39991.1 hypothetical protein GCM10010259_33130 [Streptomyces daghestanicus]GHI31039.1 hypothetical protein Sdagh_27690 [Streptomyces daghestanicus]